jgi:hypothetical protein
MTSEEILKNAWERAKALTYKNENELDDIRKKGKMALENLFPTKTYFIDINNIKFSQFHYIQMPETTYKDDWEKGKNELVNLLDTALLDNDEKQKIKKVESQPLKEKIVFRDKIVSIIDDSAVNSIKLEFQEYKKAVFNWAIYLFSLIILTISIWMMFFFSEWKWYEAHPKKIGMTLMLNLLVIVGLLNIPISHKWTIWVPIAITVLITIFALI